MRRYIRAAAVPAVAAAAVLGFQSAASAHDHSTVYVAPGVVVTLAANNSGGSDCRHPDATTIQQGVGMAPAGGTVVVCPGTYRESVTISTPRLTLQGKHGAVIDASGLGYGVGIAADKVTVDGLTIKNAGAGTDPDSCGGPDNFCAGITTGLLLNGTPTVGNRLTITDNVLTGNVAYGINVISTHDSLIEDNESNGNGIGINVVDDAPGVPVQNNKIIDNEANDNTNGCGIALASHTGAGVIGNLVTGNEADRNGLASGGAGVLLASPIPGGVVRDNTLSDNSMSGNGHAGVEVHFHAPGDTVSGNKILDNEVGRNNVIGDDSAGDPATTGILIGSNSPLTIVVKGNEIRNDDIGIFQAGPAVTTVRPDANDFRHVAQPFVTSTLFT